MLNLGLMVWFGLLTHFEPDNLVGSNDIIGASYSNSNWFPHQNLLVPHPKPMVPILPKSYSFIFEGLKWVKRLIGLQ